MDAQDHTTHSGHESHHGHGFHSCHRCGWPFPNPHPSAKHRRAHKKICGTIEGYTNLIGSEVVSDDEHHSHSDDDKDKTPSPKIDRKTRSEDEVFADAVTEFVDGGSAANKSLDRDLFFSFKDAENAEISNVDTSIEVSEKTDPHLEKIEETEIKPVGDLSESNLELTGAGGLVKDGVVEPAPEPSYVSQSEEAKSNDVVEAGEEKGQESQTSETITQEAKDSEVTKTTPEVSAIVGEYDDNVKQENSEKLESVKNTDGISEEIKQEIKSDCEQVSEAVKESEAVEEIKIVKSELDHEIAPEVAKESEIDQNASAVNEKVDLGAPDEQEVVKEHVTVLTEKKDLEASELEKISTEQIQEAVKEPVAVLIEKEDLGGPQLEKQSIKHTHEIVEKPDSVLIEKDLGTPKLEGSSEFQIQEVVKEPDTVLTEEYDLGGRHLEKQSNEHAHEVVEKPDSVLTEKQDLGAPESENCTKENIVEQPDLVLTEKEEDLKSTKDEVIEEKVNNDCNLVADVSTGNSVTDSKNASGVVPEPVIEEGNGKLLNNQDSGADLTVDSSSLNSLEGTWGSVSVLSTTSIDAETLQATEKSKVNSGKSNSSDVFEPPSFMTLVEPESKDNKSGPSEVQDSQPQPNSEASQAGWFPTLTNVSNESEGRKKNEEVIAKVTNWSAEKQSTPLKNLLGEARSPSGKQSEPVVQNGEATVNPSVNDEVSSPPKLIDDGKKGRKKAKGISSWVPFACCSSVNAVK